MASVLWILKWLLTFFHSHSSVAGKSSKAPAGVLHRCGSRRAIAPAPRADILAGWVLAPSGTYWETTGMGYWLLRWVDTDLGLRPVDTLDTLSKAPYIHC